jgi:hypothetical protein
MWKKSTKKGSNKAAKVKKNSDFQLSLTLWLRQFKSLAFSALLISADMATMPSLCLQVFLACTCDFFTTSGHFHLIELPPSPTSVRQVLRKPMARVVRCSCYIQ